MTVVDEEVSKDPLPLKADPFSEPAGHIIFLRHVRAYTGEIRHGGEDFLDGSDARFVHKAFAPGAAGGGDVEVPVPASRGLKDNHSDQRGFMAVLRDRQVVFVDDPEGPGQRNQRVHVLLVVR